MLNEVLEYLNNSFFTVNDTSTGFEHTYEISGAVFTKNDTITADFEDTFLAGEYVYISGSRMNDGFYLIHSISNTELQIDTTIDLTLASEPAVDIVMVKANIPGALISLIEAIKDAGCEDGLASETQGRRSVSYSKGSGWQDVFKGRLARYKKVKW